MRTSHEFAIDDEEELAVGLYDRDIIRFGSFTLKSGRPSPIYYNQRPLLSVDLTSQMSRGAQRRLVSLAVEGYASHVPVGFEPVGSRWNGHLYAIPQAATAIGALVAHETGHSYLWGRVGDKDYGQHAKIEGDFSEGDFVVQLDDVVTSADSKIESADALFKAGLSTREFVVMLDREEGGRQALDVAGHNLSSVLKLSDTVAYLRENNRIGGNEVEALQAYHENLQAEGVASTFLINYRTQD